MGYVLNPEDWKLERNVVPQAEPTEPILMSYVRCKELDTDIRKCKLAEHVMDFEGSCGHDQDVGLRCYDVSWAGMRLGMTSKRSKLYDVKVEKAGLFDYRTFQFRPAIQADLSHHVYEKLEVVDNYHDGLGVLYSDLYFPDHVNFIKDSTFANNRRHGISFRQLGMRVTNTQIRDNVRAGIHHDPKLTKLEQRELSEWMSLIDESKPDTIIRLPDTDAGTRASDPIILKEGESRLLVTSPNVTIVDATKVYYIKTERDEFVIGMQLINPFHNYTTEMMTVYDFNIVKDSPNIKVNIYSIYYLIVYKQIIKVENQNMFLLFPPYNSLRVIFLLFICRLILFFHFVNCLLIILWPKIARKC